MPEPNQAVRELSDEKSLTLCFKQRESAMTATGDRNGVEMACGPLRLEVITLLKDVK